MQPVSWLTRTRLMVVIAIVTIILGGSLALVGLRLASSSPGTTITVHFTEAPGIYVGNHVDVLGIPVGSITKITEHPTYVAVTLEVNSSVKVPKQVVAAIMAPELVNDRYIQLDPPYRGGAVMENNGLIPMAQTALPESVDQIISNLDQLIQALGPNGANRQGAVSRFIHDVASTVGGNGPSFHTTVTALGQVLSTLSSESPELATVLDNLGSFTQVAAANTSEFQSFANDLAGVSGVVAADSTDIGTVLSNLQQVLARVTSFVHDNQSSLGATLSNLQTFTAAVASQQQQLGQAFDEGGLVLQNVNNSIVTEPNGSTALRTRLDPALDTPGFVSQICGTTELPRILILGGSQKQAPEFDLACAASSGLAQITPPPNAAQGPDLSIQALMAGAK